MVLQNKAVSLHRNQKTKGYKQNKSFIRRSPRHKQVILKKANIITVAAIAALNPEGFTIDANTLESVTSGYAVALAETQNSFGNEGITNVLASIEAGHANAIGGWLDTQTGLYYYDAVRIYTDINAAYQAARDNEQLAFFDLDKLEEIRVINSLEQIA